MKTLPDYIAIETAEEDVRCGNVRTSVMSAMSDEPWPRRSDARIREDARVRMDRVGTKPTMFKGW